MVWLSLTWFVLGLWMGCISLVAHMLPTRWIKKYRHLALFTLAGLAGCFGGWLGVWLFGRLFGDVTAIWIAGIVVCAVPWGVHSFSDFCYNGSRLREMRK